MMRQVWMMVGIFGGVCMFMTAPLRAPQDRFDGKSSITVRPDTKIVLPWFSCYRPEAVKVPSSPPDDAGAQDALVAQRLTYRQAFEDHFKTTSPKVQALLGKISGSVQATVPTVGEVLPSLQRLALRAFLGHDIGCMRDLLREEREITSDERLALLTFLAQDADLVRGAVLDRAHILTTHRQVMLGFLEKLGDRILHFDCKESEDAFIRLHNYFASFVRELAREKEGLNTKIADRSSVKRFYSSIQRERPGTKERVRAYVDSLTKLCFPNDRQEARIQALLPQVCEIWNAAPLPVSLKEGVTAPVTKGAPEKCVPNHSPLLPGGFALEAWAKVLDHLLAKGMIHERVSLELTCTVLYHLSFSSHRFQHALLLRSFYFNVPEGNTWACVNLKGPFCGDDGVAYGHLKHGRECRSERLICTLNPPQTEPQEVIEVTAHFSLYEPYGGAPLGKGEGSIIFGPLDVRLLTLTNKK
ncbi:hypothetical protein [Candidatus Hepatobacter penaei]|uniref:hypothetical protein n=1 Tax=Candidatus Hepatobacter penaei TaxID=1274402 RepID=UPI0012E003DB|nr:hypothetical protein [Candidatus Hepatobacter penaei]